MVGRVWRAGERLRSNTVGRGPNGGCRRSPPNWFAGELVASLLLVRLQANHNDHHRVQYWRRARLGLALLPPRPAGVATLAPPGAWSLGGRFPFHCESQRSETRDDL
jgi:hypothetical protein